MGRPRVHADDAARKRAWRKNEQDRNVKQLYEAIVWAAGQEEPTACKIVEAALGTGIRFRPGMMPPTWEQLVPHLRMFFLTHGQDWIRASRRG